jgi:hypothetical protein
LSSLCKETPPPTLSNIDGTLNQLDQAFIDSKMLNTKDLSFQESSYKEKSSIKSDGYDYFDITQNKLSDTQKEKIVFSFIDESKGMDDAHHVRIDDILNSSKSVSKVLEWNPLSARINPVQHKENAVQHALLSSRESSTGYLPLSVRN